MKYAIALALLAAAAQARSAITDNFLDEEREADFRVNLIFELARQDIPISNEMVGGAFQFGQALSTGGSDVTHSRDSTTGETVHTIPLSGDLLKYFSHFPGCPERVACHLQIRTPKGEALRPAFLKGDTFLIQNVEVTLSDSGAFSHTFTLSEAQRGPQAIQPIPGKERKAAIECTAPSRLKQWSLTAGFNNYLYPFFTKEKKEKIASAPLPDFPPAGGGGAKAAAQGK